MPNIISKPFIKVGCFDNDDVNLLNNVFVQQLNANTTVVSLTNPTVATDMMTLSVPANTLNLAGQALEFFAAGTYNLGVASTLVFTIKLGGVTLATFTTASQATTGVTLAWNMTLYMAVVTPGVSGTLETHGELNFDSGATLAAACSTFLDSNTAVSSAINFTNINTLEVMSNLGSGNAASNISQRLLQVQLLN